MNDSIYLDNAATTRLSREVLDAMMPYLTEHFGNPSSTYSKGRATRIAVEAARKTVAQLLGVTSSTIYFTSGGTESNNTAIAAAIRDLGCTCIITSPVEHHAVLHTAEYYSRREKVPLLLVSINEDGTADYQDLEQKLKEQCGAGHKCLVSLMHANNEIGTLLDIKRVGDLCKMYQAIFHSDCVQTVGHYPLNLSELPVHFISAAGHKFHGPKGSGILYVHPSIHIQPLLYGGGQERNMRAGTENVYGIIGFAKALELAMKNLEEERRHIGGLKAYMKAQLIECVPGVQFNGNGNGLYTVLSVCFPKTAQSDMLLLNLDMEGICVSGGSACSSGGGSHVMTALNRAEGCTTIRFSFSKDNSIAEIDRVIAVLRSILVSEETMDV
ncbi:MAG TPA: cysteine desulfurase family protein [Flavisolibacter sp.]|nr:cysteine desulfurase family protein [Flavisolibacter sp.]